MNKAVLFLFLNLLVLVKLSGQDSTVYKHEVAVNVTNLLANVFSLKNDNLSTPYVLNYSFRISDKWRLRAGLGFAYNQDDNGSVQGVSAESRSSDMRLGTEYELKIAGGLSFMPGLDALWGHKSVESRANGFSLNTSSTRFGAGPVFRLVYCFKNRITLMTELPAYYVITQGKRAEFDPILGPSEVSFKDRSFSLSEPTVLYIGIRF